MKIFDSLTHIKKDGSWYGTKHNASLDRLLKEFDKGLTKTLLVGMPNDDINYIIDIVKKYSDIQVNTKYLKNSIALPFYGKLNISEIVNKIKGKINE